MGRILKLYKRALLILLPLVGVFLLAINSCKKVEQELQVKVETGSVTSYAYSHAVVTGALVDLGGGKIDQHGFCYSSEENPSIADASTKLGSMNSIGSFSDSITGLTSGTAYHIRAYAIASDEIFYGDALRFTTLSPVAAQVSITAMGSYENDTVRISCEVSNDGGSEVSARGICWGLEENPVIEGFHTVDGSGTGDFQSTITGLNRDTVYYFRAYATSSVGTSYSDQQELRTPPGNVTVITADIYGITMSYALGGGHVICDAGVDVSARGVCWETTPNPDITDYLTNDGSGPGNFSSEMLGLNSGTLYYVRAYAITSNGTFYGDERSFTTTGHGASLPVLTTVDVTSITENSAVSGGNISDDGGTEIIARGVCWSADGNPDLSGNFTMDGTGTGSYASSISGLAPNTTYNVRAYASNAEGTEYGNMVSFTTDEQAVLPTLTTSAASSVTQTSAVSGGNITDNGGAQVIARGVCWSTSEHPEITDSFTEDGTGSGSFPSSLTGLVPNTTYYVRAYATNKKGTGYGNQVSFTTQAASSLATLTTQDATSITENSAISGGNISDDGGSDIIARGVCWSINSGPDLVGDHTTNGTGTGTFTSAITGLAPNTTYYVRAYATNGEGTAFGEEVSFTTNSSPSSPTVTTSNVTEVTAYSAKTGGNVTDGGGSLVSARGVCWSTSTSPDFSGNHTEDGSGTGSFMSTLTGLDPATTYYVRAYATNSSGTEFGEELSFTTSEPSETVTDIDGNVYGTVVIGTQTWITENLKVTHYNNGDEIKQISGDLDWAAAKEGAYCYFDNDLVTYGVEYGALYNWYTIEDSRGLCPEGWHVPSMEEWNVLVDFAGGNAVAGARLKEVGNDHWHNNNSSTTDEYGFSAFGGGERTYEGSFRFHKTDGYWWSSSSYSDYAGRYYKMRYFDNTVSNATQSSEKGCSIRCVKD